jgi:Zn-dependent peptidase ImmA (M78 family)/transcriptional regulator with XRE-family HTH domain
MPEKANTAIGERLAALRKAHHVTQEELARLMHLDHAQIVSAIERGERALKATELVEVARVLRVSPLDLLRNVEARPKPLVRWREVVDEQARVEEEQQFISRCRKYALVERLAGESSPRVPLQTFPLDVATTSYDVAAEWADDSRKRLGLGDMPAPAIHQVLEHRAGIKIFLSELKAGSGAATRGDFGNAILENRAEPIERRAFSLAHELFHLVTWDSLAGHGPDLPPAIEKRNEQLANVFASSLLLPAEPLLNRVGTGSIGKRTIMEVVSIARDFGVSVPALVFRLRNLERLDQDDADRILQDPDRVKAEMPQPRGEKRELPERFVLLAFKAFVDGEISEGRLAELLETTVGKLPKVLRQYGFDLDSDVYQTEVLPA